ncbi:DUF5677 domain-containing protein [Bradyrhizobium sp. JYMT SZCCT0428]|uniref:DUF5677 domain-containing protein n=1 Tax=Bradyrhizobium sp. JYMT SZCCT0428 TaxID=2807673 RepID=UPI001BA4FE44|nr:DUF5677 domain-containing protein [Bradyrhizobium sp. JYMT SZCCT0428]MBR1151920.1 hypothetical protein [Bradyrhizobium sp. JYMT SZCCT0428]
MESDEALTQIFQQLLADGTLSVDQMETEGPRIAADFINKAAAVQLRDLKRRMPSSLREIRRDIRGFEKRNLQRWRRAFNLLETLYLVAAETGSDFNEAERPKIAAEKDFRCEALIHIHARALLVASECLCLMKCGYPDGALSRWRTLHELTVIAAFLSQNSGEVALRYLVSFEFRAVEAGEQMKKYAPRSKVEPPTDTEINALRSRCASHKTVFGPNIGNGDYGWASDVIGKSRPNLLDLEEAVGLDHWRPRFKWSSQHNHGGHRPIGSLLAVTEVKSPVFAIGPSNSGMVDPLHMTALSLTKATSALLISRPGNADRAIAAGLLLKLSDDVGKAAAKVEHA